MINNRLNIISVTNSNETKNKQAPSSDRAAKKLEAQAKFERLWLLDPEQFNPLRNSMERERLNRTFALIKEISDPSGQQIADLGCGPGVLSVRLRDAGADKVTALDISSQALKLLKEKDAQRIETVQDYLPMTSLNDNTYDLVIATDVIAYLPPQDYRLFFSELSRLVKSEGYVVCSTSLDLNSEDALERFAALAETEFKIEKWRFSYHNLYIRLLNFLEMPAKCVRASRSKEYRQKELSQRHSLNQWFFKWNSTPIPAFFWSGIQFIIKPIAEFLKQNQKVLIFLEKVSYSIWNSNRISHAIFIGKRKPLFVQLPDKASQPIERKQKKQVWE